MYSFPDIVTSHYSDNLTLCQAAFLFCFAPGCRWLLVVIGQQQAKNIHMASTGLD